MIEALFGIVKSLLGIWEHKEKTKYLEKLLKLEEKYYEESSKTNPDMFILNDIEFRLLNIRKNIGSAIERPTVETLQE
jgi:hypothetical protein